MRIGNLSLARATLFIAMMATTPGSLTTVAFAEDAKGTPAATPTATPAVTPEAPAPAIHYPKSRIMASTMLIKSPNSWGNAFGFGYLNYESETFAIGGIVHSGQLTVGTTGSYTEGGLMAMFSYTLGKKTDFIADVVIGGGGGNAATVGGGLVLHPNLGLDIVLGKATRLVVMLGYTWLPTSTTFSGVTGNVRIDFLQF